MLLTFNCHVAAYCTLSLPPTRFRPPKPTKFSPLSVLILRIIKSMAESSVLRFSSPLRPVLAVSHDSPSSPSHLPFPRSRRARSLRLARSRGRDSDDGGIFGDDDFYGPYPWESSASPDVGSTIQWVPEDRVTLFTSEGLVQIGGSLVPRRFLSSDKRKARSKAPQRLQRFQESDYMDPEQGLCLGALFDIAATNGLDMGRRLCIFGFCRSIEMLSDVVEDTVIEHGGEVVATEKANKGGMQEKLIMSVAVPLLWGVPPVSDTLRVAVRSGGGIVEKVYWQWDFL